MSKVGMRYQQWTFNASRFRNTQKDLARVSAMDAESYYIS